nr:sigma factor-like helix-turn-helix DNA-binding protein [Sulfobacillus thermosulfidooxidans]
MDRSLKETATALGVSEQVVKTRLYRARQHLRPLLEPIWKEGLI